MADGWIKAERITIVKDDTRDPIPWYNYAPHDLQFRLVGEGDEAEVIIYWDGGEVCNYLPARWDQISYAPRGE